ncbi:hypothetical protein ACJZ2D_003892 [Fusarium nematophilum]
MASTAGSDGLSRPTCSYQPASATLSTSFFGRDTGKASSAVLASLFKRVPSSTANLAPAILSGNWTSIGNGLHDNKLHSRDPKSTQVPFHSNVSNNSRVSQASPSLSDRARRDDKARPDDTYRAPSPGTDVATVHSDDYDLTSSLDPVPGRECSLPPSQRQSRMGPQGGAAKRRSSMDSDGYSDERHTIPTVSSIRPAYDAGSRPLTPIPREMYPELDSDRGGQHGCQTGQAIKADQEKQRDNGLRHALLATPRTTNRHPTRESWLLGMNIKDGIGTTEAAMSGGRLGIGGISTEAIRQMIASGLAHLGPSIKEGEATDRGLRKRDATQAVERSGNAHRVAPIFIKKH